MTSGRTLLACVKYVPVGGQGLRVANGELTRDGLAHGLDPINEVGLEWALQAREAGAVDRVVAVTLGPPEAIDALRKALAMGADEAVLVTDEAFRGAGVRATAAAVAAVALRVDAGVVVAGYESADGSSGAVPAATAALLGWPLVSRLMQGEVSGGLLRGQRDLGHGIENVEADLPAVVSVVEGWVTPRYPKLKDLLRTKAATATTWSGEDLGITAGPPTETVVRLVEVPRPPKAARVLSLEDGVDELLAMLAGADRG